MRHVRERRAGAGDRTRAGEGEAETPDCVGRHMCAHGGGLRACEAYGEAYGRAFVEEVRGAMEGERIGSGLLPEEFEEVRLPHLSVLVPF